jgi:hypothetical protein
LQGGFYFRDANAALHENGEANPRASQLDAFFGERDAEHGRACSLTGTGYLDGSMAVAVGFDDGKDCDMGADQRANLGHVTFNR